MKKNAFTLIELLVVVSIITIISVGWVFYFFDFLEEQELEQNLVFLQEDFEILDREVENYEIFDYRISYTGDSQWYIINKNTSVHSELMEVDFDFWESMGHIKAMNGTWYIEIYKNEKKTEGIPLPLSNNHEISFELPYMRIEWPTNSIEIHTFSKESVEQEGSFQIIGVYDRESSWGRAFSSFTLENIFGKRRLLADGIEVSEVYMLFSFAGKEKFLKIE